MLYPFHSRDRVLISWQGDHPGEAFTSRDSGLGHFGANKAFSSLISVCTITTENCLDTFSCTEKDNGKPVGSKHSKLLLVLDKNIKGAKVNSVVFHNNAVESLILILVKKGVTIAKQILAYSR